MCGGFADGLRSIHLLDALPRNRPSIPRRFGYAAPMKRTGTVSSVLLAMLVLIAEGSTSQVARAQVLVPAATDAVVDVRGDLAKPGPLKVSELESLGKVTATWTLHGKTHTVVGVPLEKVLRRFGWDPGVMSKTVPPTEKRAGYKRVIVLSAKDGFQSVFSAAELAEGMGKSQVLLVWTVDGKPLPAEQGPLRLVVPSDGEPSRSLYQLARIDVVDMRRVVPSGPDRK